MKLHHHVYFILSIFVFLIFFLLVVGNYYFPLLDPDSGYFLCLSRAIYNGKIYFLEIGTIYNPLAILIYGIPFLFSEFPDFRFSFFINFIFAIGSSILLFQILKKINGYLQRNIFYALYYLLVLLMLDGCSLMLETITVFFQLLSLIFYFQFKESKKLTLIFFTGIAVSLAFLSKQNGLFIIAVIGIDIIITKQLKIKNLLSLAFGIIVPILIFYFYLIYNGLGLKDCLKYSLGQGVALDMGNGTGLSYNFFTYSLGFIFFGAYNCYLVFIPIFLLKNKNKLNNKNLIYFLPFIFSLSVFFTASYMHYFQFILPYSFIMYVYCETKFNNNLHLKFHKTAYIFSIFFLGAIVVYTFFRKETKMQNQEILKNTLQTNITKNAEVYLDGISPAFYYLNEFNSINLKKIGFCFPGYFFESTIVNEMKKDSFLLLNEKAKKKYFHLFKQLEVSSILINNEKYFVCKKK